MLFLLWLGSSRSLHRLEDADVAAMRGRRVDIGPEPRRERRRASCWPLVWDAQAEADVGSGSRLRPRRRPFLPAAQAKAADGERDVLAGFGTPALMFAALLCMVSLSETQQQPP